MDIHTILSSDNYHTRFYPSTSTPPPPHLEGLPRPRPVLRDIQLNSRTESSCAAYLGLELKFCGVFVKSGAGCEVGFDRGKGQTDGDPNAEVIGQMLEKEGGNEQEGLESGDGDRDVTDEVQAENESDEMKEETGFTAMRDLELTQTLPLTPPEESTSDHDHILRSNMNPISKSKIRSSGSRALPKLKIEQDHHDDDKTENEDEDVESSPRKKRKCTPKQATRRPSHPHLSDEDSLARRRLQLRRSQATYRARRELTITSLRQQVAFLEATRKEMRGLLMGLWGELGRRGVLREVDCMDVERGD
ncbi:hypothetical protein BKA64DRAFT_651228 [Cadophora sp. MPI-SDFR-AT-0126]|nr:hypothetical protein BKA64DRAFT_651228 [Leotiomycetes sp. MPI-SDFR-AT-0126]